LPKICFTAIVVSFLKGYIVVPICIANLPCADRRLTTATGITPLLVPVLYAIFVLDLKIAKWEERKKDISNE